MYDLPVLRVMDKPKTVSYFIILVHVMSVSCRF